MMCSNKKLLPNLWEKKTSGKYSQPRLRTSDILDLVFE